MAWRHGHGHTTLDARDVIAGNQTLYERCADRGARSEIREIVAPIENSAIRLLQSVQRLTWPSMLSIGWSSPGSPAIMGNSRARSSIG